jgi:glycosyltransferase involved in cell wall biosynthesis
LIVGAEDLRVWLACDWFVKYVGGLARGLDEIGCHVVLLTREHDQEFGGDPGAMRAFVEATAGGTRHVELAGRVRDPSGGRETFRVARLRRSWRPQIVHLQDSVANDLRLALASGLPRAPYALTVHDPVPHPGDATSPRLLQAARRALRRRASLVFVHSEALAGELAATGEVDARIEVVPHGTGPSVYTVPPSDSLLFFGRISYYKGLDILLDAMDEVWKARPGVTLTVAGEGEIESHPALSDPRVVVRQEHVREVDVPDLFHDATAVVLPYRQASQSGVGSLALQYGRPVIASRLGGLPELVGGDRGRLVPSEDPAALAQSILEVLGEPGLAEQMGRSAVAAVEDEVGWKAVAERTVECYRRYLL